MALSILNRLFPGMLRTPPATRRPLAAPTTTPLDPVLPGYKKPVIGAPPKPAPVAPVTPKGTLINDATQRKTLLGQ